MGLEPTDLDDLTYDELLEDARTLLPVAAEEWTDLNAHDPGITVVELLAWLTESYGYQLDQITDEHRRKFLELLGTRPRPPRPAEGRVRFESSVARTVPAGTTLRSTDGTGCSQSFRTAHDCTLTDSTLAAVHTAADGTVTDNTGRNTTDRGFFRAFGPDPDTGDALLVGFEGDPFSGETLSLGIDRYDPETTTVGGDRTQFVPSVELAWEYCTDHTRWDDTAAWASVPVVRDDTARLYRSGTVRLGRPADWSSAGSAASSTPVQNAPAGLWWLRCRVVEPGYEVPPRIDRLRPNVVPVTQGATAAEVTLERVEDETGVPALDDQRFRFPRSPVVSATVTVDGVAWTEVPDFDASASDDRHYVLDRTAGVVRFGDGRRGAAPPADATVRAQSVTYGGGSDGNLPAAAVWRIADSASLPGTFDEASVEVTPWTQPSGGTDAESVDAALQRARHERATPSRAVSADDYETLAAETPGVRIARTTASVDGPTVTVVVVPAAPEHCGRPTPSDGLLDAVQRYLDERRLLTDRVDVVGPTYVDLDVSLSVEADSGGDAAVHSAVERYLDPLDGFDGDGWPFGRALSEDELATEVADAADVERVSACSITAHGDATIDSEGRISIGPTSLFALGDVRVRSSAEQRRAVGGERSW